MIYSVEQLAINDSFIAYCYEQDVEAMSYWNKYLAQHPEQLKTMQEAKELVLGLKTMLYKKQDELSADTSASHNTLYVVDHKATTINHENGRVRFLNGLKKWLPAASVILILMLPVLFLLSERNKLKIEKTAISQKIITETGMHKKVFLPDGTSVTLNAGSELSVSPTFGKKDRNVYLIGEGLFDVAHNKELPFVVHTDRYKVKALGTRFNVKCYMNDPTSETSLLEGKVQILVNGGAKDVVYKTLEVNQKFVIKNESDSIQTKEEVTAHVAPLAYDDANRNIETAWVNNFLIFEDMKLGEIKNILERRFDVEIVIKDSKLLDYRYTASFEKETIDEILEALQLSYPFSYKQKESKIILEK
ncbi:FecR family protein [Niabella ginsengisoli]|uniref:FecR family protein n=1 Tax=Niabella ginsengisoli TaxID=522298 RepID=A0ABS9SHM0_9BACT|nr:FecR family protein [Niabella ginsengisoli]MCH5597867.1 FecR family protein [Niabella ginsengisoli]